MECTNWWLEKKIEYQLCNDQANLFEDCPKMTNDCPESSTTLCICVVFMTLYYKKDRPFLDRPNSAAHDVVTSSILILLSTCQLLQ